MCTLPAFAANQLTVVINGLGNAKSANVLFRGKPLDNQCATAPNSRISGDLDGAGEFSVNFYSTQDCSGKREQFHQYQLQAPGGEAVCNSDTDCFFKTLTSAPNNQNSAVVTVLFKGLGNSQGASVLFGGKQQGNCITADKVQSGQNTITFPLFGAGMFSVNFYSNTGCTGTRTHFHRYSAQQGSNGAFVGCDSDTSCTCQGFGC